MADDRLTEIAARLAAATSGPWLQRRDAGIVTDAEDRPIAVFGTSGPHCADAAFTAHAPEDMQWLLAEVERLRTVVAALAEGTETLQEENTRLRAEQQTLVGRARRVADAHRWSIEDSSDPGTEALCAQYELVNHLATLPRGDDLPVNTVEQALRIVLDLLDQYDENVTPGEIRVAIAKALPHNGVDKRRGIYLDGKGNAWILHSVASDGTRWVSKAGRIDDIGVTTAMVKADTGSLREIGRTW